jgi:hypothetical protein
MSNPHINELRTHLMATLADLRDRVNPMEPDRARAVAQVAGVLIDSAKVENEYLKLTGQDRSDFLEAPTTETVRISHTVPTAHNPFPVTRHQLQG